MINSVLAENWRGVLLEEGMNTGPASLHATQCTFAGGSVALAGDHPDDVTAELNTCIVQTGTAFYDVQHASSTHSHLNAGDPLFVDPAVADYTLLPGSPCIDAGDPALPDDPDGTRADMGASIRLTDLGPLPVAVEHPDERPSAFALHQNTPNPFNPSTTIRFGVTQDGPVRLSIYTIAGQLVTTLSNRHMTAGEHVVRWDGTDRDGRPAASGVYLYRLTSPEGTLVERMVMVR